MRPIIRWLRAIIFILLPALALPLHAEPLRLNSGVGAPYFLPDKKGFLDLLIPEVFRRIGIEAEAVRYPAAERALINANNGIDDGMALRIRGLEKLYPNLVRIDEKIIDNEFVAYATSVRFATTGFDTLKNYQVGYINGWKIFESGLLPDTPVTKVQEADQLFALLAQDRADVILFERWQGNHIIRERGIKAKMLQPPLATTEMFMYLHTKHARLVEPAARALRAMKADGTYQRIAAQSLPSLPGK
ncbi:MAG: transporter substrate-binding domain-containing protein [Rhodocyclaceae bacterium]|nr:transporter substrate-binding domain-containing protein [Rhodocyclaceae bacterium]